MVTRDAINNTLSGQTGTGSYAGSTSPSFTTPAIGAATGTSLNLGSSTTMTGMIDDDTMATATASTAASSESIKAYVDAQLGGTPVVTVQSFTASGTYTPTAGMKYCIVEAVAGGGGSGGCATGGGSIYVSSAGGGAGGYARVLYTAVEIGASQGVTIGAAGAAGSTGENTGGTGGTTTFGATLFSCTGGVGGTGGNTGQSGRGGLGGTPTITTGTQIAIQSGAPGNTGTGNGAGTYVAVGGAGGSSPFGAGGRGLGAPEGVGGAAIGYGGGGGGSGVISGTQAGAAGAPGYLVVTEFA